MVLRSSTASYLLLPPHRPTLQLQGISHLQDKREATPKYFGTDQQNNGLVNATSTVKIDEKKDLHAANAANAAKPKPSRSAPGAVE